MSSRHTWAALRHRRGQAVLLTLVAALVIGCAGAAAIVGETLLRGLVRAQVNAWPDRVATVELSAKRTAAFPSASASTLAAQWPARRAGPVFGPGVGTMAAPALIDIPGEMSGTPLTVRSREPLCEAVVLVVGECPTAPGKVLVSSADAASRGWQVGTVLHLRHGATASSELTVSGVYDIADHEGLWDVRPDGKSGLLIDGELDLVKAVDDLLTTESTFGPSWVDVDVGYRVPIDRAALTVESLPEAKALAGSVKQGPQLRVASPLPELGNSLNQARDRLGLLIPLVLAQLLVLGAVVMVLVLRAAVDDRRSVVALARLRGRSRGQTRTMLWSELGIPLLLALPLGALVALGVNDAVRRFVVPGGVPLTVPAAFPVSLLLGWLLAMALLVTATRAVVAAPVQELLREVPPTTAGPRRTPIDVAVALAVMAVGGALAAKALLGPVASIAPVVIALGLAVVVCGILIRPLTTWGRGWLQHRSLAGALAVLDLARRQGLRPVVVAVAMSATMTVFAADLLAVGSLNRTTRTELEAGAPSVLTTDATSLGQLAAALDAIPERDRAHATPVAVVTPRAAGSLRTLALRPRDLGRATFTFAQLDADVLAKVATPTVPPQVLSGSTLAATATWTLDGLDTLATVPLREDQQPSPSDGLDLGISVRMADGQLRDRLLVRVARSASGTLSFTAPLLCPDTCVLAGLWLRWDGPANPKVTGTVDLMGATLDDSSLGWTDATPWRASAEEPNGGRSTLEAVPGGLRLTFTNTGSRVLTPRADVPDPLPVIGTPGAPTAPAFSVATISGAEVSAVGVARVPGLPQVLDEGVLVDYDTMSRLGMTDGGSTELALWTTLTDRASLRALSEALSTGGVQVTAIRYADDRRAALDTSAAAWATRVLLLAAALGVVLGAGVVLLVGVTVARGRAADLSQLLSLGLSRATIGRSVLIGQILVTTVAAAIGVGVGVFAAFVAGSALPAFDDSPALPAPDWSPQWPAMSAAALATWVVCLCAALISTRMTMSRVTSTRRDHR